MNLQPAKISTNECEDSTPQLGGATVRPEKRPPHFDALVLDAMDLSVIVTDLSGRIVRWNDHAAKTYGWTHEEVVGKDIVELLTPMPKLKAAGEIMSQLRSGGSWIGEFRVRRKDGSTFPAEIVNSPLCDVRGGLVGIIGVSRDVSERKRAGEVLRRSEEKYRVLVEQASDGIHTYDTDGNFIDTNSKLCEMLGYRREELLRLNVRDLVPADELIANPIRFDELLAGRTLLKERRLLRKGGTYLDAEISGKAISENMILGIVRDITERKNIQRQTQESEERLRTILEASHDGILVEDEEKIIYANRSYLDLFGFNLPEELIGQPTSAIIAPEDRERVLAYGRRRLDGRDTPAKYEFKGRRKDGSPIDVEASVSVSEAAGRKYITTFIRDVRERKRFETLIEAQKQALELVVTGSPLNTVLTYLTKVVERQSEGTAIASILLLDDENRLRNGASPNLPDDYLQAIDGLKADKSVGTCSAAAATGETVITPDIAGDPKWTGISHLPLGIGYVAAWSKPIAAHDGHVLGTFGTYFRTRREPTAFEQQSVEILARTAALAIEQSRAEEELRSSKSQLELVTDAIPQLVSFVDSSMRYRFVNKAYSEWFGRQRDEILGRRVPEILSPRAFEKLLPEIEKALAGIEVVFECAIPYQSGERYVHVNYIPERDRANGNVLGFHAFVRDITARKEAEAALERSRLELEARVQERTRELQLANSERVKILQQLVGAQEDERRRIARDLHDQLGQQLTLLRLKLEIVEKKSADGEELLEEIAETRKIARQLDTDVDFLAWKFRPAVLDDIGIVAALDHYVRQWSEHFRISAEFDAKRVGRLRPSPEAESNFYRITQEALNNISKHAAASKVVVLLEPRGGELVLIIEDDGVGFDPEEQLKNRNGMGLVGMRERAALVGGTLEIESAKNAGTTIFVTAPSQPHSDE